MNSTQKFIEYCKGHNLEPSKDPNIQTTFLAAKVAFNYQQLEIDKLKSKIAEFTGALGALMDLNDI